MSSPAEDTSRVTTAKPHNPVRTKEESCASAREAGIILPTEDAMASMNIGNAAIAATLTPEAGMPTHAPSTVTRTMPFILPSMSRRKTGIIIARYDYVGSKAHLVPRLMEEGHRRGIDLEVIGCADCVLSESYVAMPIQQKDDAGTETTNGGSEVAISGTNAPGHDDNAIGTPAWSENNAHRRQARQVRRAINRCAVPCQYMPPVIPLHHCVPVPECDVAIVRCDSGHITSVPSVAMSLANTQRSMLSPPASLNSALCWFHTMEPVRTVNPYCEIVALPAQNDDSHVLSSVSTKSLPSPFASHSYSSDARTFFLNPSSVRVIKTISTAVIASPKI